MKKATLNALSPSHLPGLRLRSRPSTETLSIFRSTAPAASDLYLRRPSSYHQTLIVGPAIHRDQFRISGRILNSMSEVDSKKIEEGDKEAPLPSAEEKRKRELPPPPEQPEPGDCCGSGCVRCVWDVYYDELEEYNKLVKEISPQSPADSSASPSKD